MLKTRPMIYKRDYGPNGLRRGHALHGQEIQRYRSEPLALARSDTHRPYFASS